MIDFKNLESKVDWVTTLVPFCIVLAMMLIFMQLPEQSKTFVDTVRGFLGNTGGLYYAVFGIGGIDYNHLCSLFKIRTYKAWQCR